MYFIQRFKYRFHQSKYGRFIQLSAHALKIMLQIHTIDIFHNDISGAIFIEEILHGYDTL